MAIVNNQPRLLTPFVLEPAYTQALIQHNTPIDGDINKVSIWVDGTRQDFPYTGKDSVKLTGLSGTHTLKMALVDDFVASSDSLLDAQITSASVLSINTESVSVLTPGSVLAVQVGVNIPNGYRDAPSNILIQTAGSENQNSRLIIEHRVSGASTWYHTGTVTPSQSLHLALAGEITYEFRYKSVYTFADGTFEETAYTQVSGSYTPDKIGKSGLDINVNNILDDVFVNMGLIGDNNKLVGDVNKVVSDFTAQYSRILAALATVDEDGNVISLASSYTATALGHCESADGTVLSGIYNEESCKLNNNTNKWVDGPLAEYGRQLLLTTADGTSASLSDVGKVFQRIDGTLTTVGGVLSNVDGKVSGWLSQNDGRQSHFDILADSFAVGHYNSGGTYVNDILWDTNTKKLKISGDLNAAGGTFAGQLQAATGTFAGSLSAATGTFAGSLSAATGSFAGTLSAATGSFSGAVTATSGSFDSGTFSNCTIEETCTVLGTLSVNNLVGDVYDANVYGGTATHTASSYTTFITMNVASADFDRTMSIPSFEFDLNGFNGTSPGSITMAIYVDGAKIASTERTVDARSEQRGEIIDYFFDRAQSKAAIINLPKNKSYSVTVRAFKSGQGTSVSQTNQQVVSLFKRSTSLT